eukprot:7388837-Prymnesium_polylepis.2
MCRDAARGVTLLTAALEAAAEVARRQPGGELTVKEAAAAVDESEADKGRARLMARLDGEAEGGGDEDDED